MDQVSPKAVIQGLYAANFTQWEIAERLGISTSEISLIMKYDKPIAQPKEPLKDDREAYLWYKYQMSVAEYDELLEAQGGCCFICKRTPEQLGKRLHVEHNHSTGKVRGLCCSRCNTLLAAFNENVALACNAVEYLTVPPASNTTIRNADQPRPMGSINADWDKLGTQEVYKGAAVLYPSKKKAKKDDPQP